MARLDTLLEGLAKDEPADEAARERVAGAGSLPGAVNEAGATKLPDERTDAEQYMTAAGATAALAAGANALREQVMGATEQAKRTTQQTVAQAG